ncbi:MAG: serine hydrolase [Pseudomonadota bacterium]
MFRRVAIAVCAILVGGVTYLYLSYGSIARGGSGYAAKNICSGYFLSGFSPETMKDEALKGASSLLADVSHTLDVEKRQVTTRLYGLFERRAIYTPGIGCTLLPAGEREAAVPVVAFPDLDVPSDLPWPQGSAAPDLTNRFDTLLEEAFAEEDPAQPRDTKAITVVHNGQLIAEKYADGVAVDTPLIGWSMAKSVTGLMTGILVGDGVLVIEASAPVSEWQEEADDPRSEITLDQLLRMSSGLEFEETYSAATDVTHMLSNEPNAAAFAASKPLAGPPDTIWSYSSGTTNIISSIIRQSVGDTLQDYYNFSQERLFQPLGIRTAVFEADRSGNFIGSSYLYASARDWARLGQFCLQSGEWNGQQIVPEGWIDYLTTPTSTTDSNIYGAQVWLNRNPNDPDKQRAFPNLPDDMYYMSGYQGQVVMVVPSEDLVITRFGFTPSRNHGVAELAAQIIEQLNSDRA